LQPSTSIGQEKKSSGTAEFLNQFDFDFLILTEAIDLDLQNFPYQYLCSPIPENTVYENLNYSEYLKGKKLSGQFCTLKFLIQKNML
jgi:hypothetical protein